MHRPMLLFISVTFKRLETYPNDFMKLRTNVSNIINIPAKIRIERYGAAKRHFDPNTISIISVENKERINKQGNSNKGTTRNNDITSFKNSFLSSILDNIGKEAVFIVCATDVVEISSIFFACVIYPACDMLKYLPNKKDNEFS